MASSIKDIKCYRKFVCDPGFDRVVYYIPTRRARNGCLIWSTLIKEWKRSAFPWDDVNHNGLFVDRQNLSEVSILEVLTITGECPLQAIERLCGEEEIYMKEEK